MPQMLMHLYATVSLAIVSFLSQVSDKKSVSTLHQFELAIGDGSDLFE
jgi:hypothetical protein